MYYFFSKAAEFRKEKKKRATSMQVWNLWLFQLCTSVFPFLLSLLFLVASWLFDFSLKAGTSDAVRKCGWKTLKLSIHKNYYCLFYTLYSTEMRWIVWFNMKMWFIFTVNAKSFEFASVHIYYILGLQTSKLWMIQIVHNNKMSSHTFLVESCFCVP